MEQQLIERFHKLRDSLRANDPSLIRFDLWQGMEAVAIPYAFQFLEDDRVQQALTDCLTACQGNTTVQSVVLQALPEPELCQALSHVSGLVNLRELRIVHNHKSQSLPVTVLTQFLIGQDQRKHQGKHLQVNKKGLLRIYLTTRLQITSQAQIDQLSASLAQHCPTLASLSLKLIPRCSIQEPDLSLDPILQACAALPHLQTVRLSAGYDHNPYGRPLVSAGALESLLQQTSTKLQCCSLQRLALENFGLQSRHVETVAKVLITNTVLTRIDLPRNPHVGVSAWQAVARVLHGQTNSNCTLHTCLFDHQQQHHHHANDSQQQQQQSYPLEKVHQEIQLATFLNRLGSQQLLQHACNHHDWIRRLAQANHPPTETTASNTSTSTSNTAVAGPTSTCKLSQRKIGLQRRQFLDDRHADVDNRDRDDAQALLSLNASYTLLRLNPSLCTLPRLPHPGQQQQQQQQESWSSTPPPPTTTTGPSPSRHLHKHTKASIVLANLKNKITTMDAAVNALSSSSSSAAPTRRRRTHHAAAGAENAADGSTLYWQTLSC
jgi:hypothetical protein